MVPTDPCQVMVESATGEVAVLREGHGTDNATVPVLFRGTRRVKLTVVDPDGRPVPDVLVNIRENRRTVVTGEVLDPVEVLQRENSRSSLGWMQKLFSGGNQRTIAVSSDGICALDLPVGSYEIMIHMLPWRGSVTADYPLRRGGTFSGMTDSTLDLQVVVDRPRRLTFELVSDV